MPDKIFSGTFILYSGLMIKHILILFQFSFILCSAIAQPYGRLYGTYFGGSNGEIISSIITDADGGYYVAGETNSLDLPTNTESYQSTLSGTPDYNDCFIAKFNADNTLAWCTYLGGIENDFIGNIVIGDNALYFCGSTYSDDLNGTAGCYQFFHQGLTEGFVGKMSLTGEMLWLTMYGTSGYDQCENIAWANDRLLVAGTSSSNDLSTPDALQTTIYGGEYDAFITAFSPDGIPEYCTYFGGESFDFIRKLLVAEDGSIYLFGDTGSAENISTEGAFQEQPGSTIECFVAKLDASFNKVWCSYFGGSNNEGSIDATLDSHGSLWLFGQTSSQDIAFIESPVVTPNPVPLLGNKGFLLHVSEEGGLMWSAMIGSSSSLDINNLTPWADGIMLGGATSLSDLPVTTNAYRSTKEGLSDGFVIGLNAEHQIMYCTYYGGEEAEAEQLVHASGSKLYLTGATSSLTGMTTPDAYEDDIHMFNGAGSDLYIAILDENVLVESINNVALTLYLYPNPASELLNMKFPHIDKWQVCIYNMQGILIRKEGTNGLLQHTIDVSALPAGIYSVQCKDAKGLVFSKNLVKQ